MNTLELLVTSFMPQLYLIPTQNFQPEPSLVFFLATAHPYMKAYKLLDINTEKTYVY